MQAENNDKIMSYLFKLKVLKIDVGICCSLPRMTWADNFKTTKLRTGLKRDNLVKIIENSRNEVFL